VTLGSVDNIMTGGAQQTTGNPYDIYIQGDGFFQLAQGDPTGTLNASAYTRAGNFKLNSDGYLTSQTGEYVLGTPAGGGAATGIKVPDGASGFAVDQNGGVSWVDPTTQQRVTGYNLQLATFPNSAGLQRAGSNEWIVSANSGAAITGAPGTNGIGSTVAGVVEMSNVDLAQTFTNMITAERGFQANSRVISTADEMLQDLVNLKR
jgi:flagellar hook protein FlgE